MKPTHFVVHSPGPTWKPDVPVFEQEGLRLRVAHDATFLAQGKLVTGGPFLDAGSGGMMIAAAPVEQQELRSFATANPAVGSGLLAFEVRPWLVGMRA